MGLGFWGVVVPEVTEVLVASGRFSLLAFEDDQHKRLVNRFVSFILVFFDEGPNFHACADVRPDSQLVRKGLWGGGLRGLCSGSKRGEATKWDLPCTKPLKELTNWAD